MIVLQEAFLDDEIAASRAFFIKIYVKTGGELHPDGLSFDHFSEQV